jgi:hypothetical protein
MWHPYINGCQAGALGIRETRRRSMDMKELWYVIIAAVVTFFGITAFAGFVESVQ